ncbi:hypothetical protein [Zwartia sp.]|uniref:hypothetical protein n=1 Tax=Zwartia sp. TaxID=2978004 RepID=UPI00272736D3|nr:hypothetical protein [Zwartia sp.]MDO9026179.1 hypothetical protein [Zwartia sp.]
MKNSIRTLLGWALLIITSLTSQASASGLTLAQYREWNRDPIKKEMLNTYTAGMGQGIVFANIYNKTQKIPMIFCPPSELPITGDLTNIVLAKFIAKNTFKASDEISIIFIFALKDAYPC